jgi:hypothetical protein
MLTLRLTALQQVFATKFHCGCLVFCIKTEFSKMRMIPKGFLGIISRFLRFSRKSSGQDGFKHQAAFVHTRHAGIPSASFL